MGIIKAPFNFVPLPEQLYVPEWAEQISQDVPFSDGVSGTIDLRIDTLSPLFIRNGHTKEDEKNNTKNYTTSCKTDDGRYYIPGTSIKGEVRSILEIMSFSRMTVDTNSRFAQREWDNQELYTLKQKQNQMHCGYLRWAPKANCYVIADCDRPYRIGMDELDHYLNNEYKMESPFKRHFSKNATDRNTKYEYDIEKELKLGENEVYDPKTAIFKYHLIGNAKLDGLRFSRKSNKNRKVVFDKQGHISGDIVLTGQPGYAHWNRPKELDPTAGKFFEFVFPKPTGKEYALSETEFNNYKFIYSDSKEWPRINTLLKSDLGVPVFFRLEAGKLKDFGLAFLYKLPYEESPYSILKKKYEAILKDNKKDVNALDLAQCIFGYVDNRPPEEKSKGIITPLKGRVQFSHAFAFKAEPYRVEGLRYILNSPKASYYPIYICQNGSNGRLGIYQNYKTYNDGQLSGWKRYVVRSGSTILPSKSSDNDKILTTIYPLKAGAVFTGKISFHNLRPVELGALLSALTFHATEKCHHQLGQGKPYGFGKADYTIAIHGKDMKGHDLLDQNYYMGCFEKEMEKLTGNNWRLSETMKNLISLVKTEVASGYDYMVLDVKNKVNNFVDAKKTKEYLQSFITLQGKSYESPSLVQYTNEEGIAKMEAMRLYDQVRAQDVGKDVKDPEIIRQYVSKLENAKLQLGQYGDVPKALDDRLNELKTMLNVLDNPTQLTVGSTVNCQCIAVKKVRIEGYDYEIQLTVPKGTDAGSLVGKELAVKIKQISKIGKIVQVEFVKTV